MSKCVHRIIQDSAYLKGLKLLTKKHLYDIRDDVMSIVDELAHFDTTSHPSDHKWNNRGFYDIHSRVDYGWVVLYKYIDDDSLYVKLELLNVNEHDEIDRFSHDSSLQKKLVQKKNDIFYEESEVTIDGDVYIKYIRDFDTKDGLHHHIELRPELHKEHIVYNVYFDGNKVSQNSDNLDSDSVKSYALENVFKKKFNIFASTDYSLYDGEEEFEYDIQGLYLAISRYLYLFFETDVDFDSVTEDDWTITFNKYGGFDVLFENDTLIVVRNIDRADCIRCGGRYHMAFINEVYNTTKECIKSYMNQFV